MFFFLLAKPHRFYPTILFGTEWITARSSCPNDQRGAKDSTVKMTRRERKDDGMINTLTSQAGADFTDTYTHLTHTLLCVLTFNTSASNLSAKTWEKWPRFIAAFFVLSNIITWLRCALIRRGGSPRSGLPMVPMQLLIIMVTLV